MGDELVSKSPSNKNAGSGGGGRSAPRFAYTKAFEEHFPYYLAMGMSYEQYWTMDCALVKSYRKAARIRTKMDNERAWIQGAYIYDALCRVAPIYHPFAKKGTKPYPWMERPYGEEEKTEQASQAPKEEEKSNAQKLFEIWAVSFNQNMKDKEDEEVTKDG